MKTYIDRHVVLLCLAVLPASAFADASITRDWPCEQGFVEEVPAAVVWDGPSIDGLADQWATDKKISALVPRLTARKTGGADAEALIAQFASAQPSAQRDQRLTLLFAAVLQVLNIDRDKLNTGILRYARDQQRRAEALGDLLAEATRLEADSSDDSKRRLDEIRQQIILKQRMFDDREQSIPYLCTRPRDVEQRIGMLARAISYHLE